jgi:hypothetical protein
MFTALPAWSLCASAALLGLRDRHWDRVLPTRNQIISKCYSDVISKRVATSQLKPAAEHVDGALHCSLIVLLCQSTKFCVDFRVHLDVFFTSFDAFSIYDVSLVAVCGHLDQGPGVFH